MQAEAAYGAAARSVAITDPAGTLDSYFRRGILIAYEPTNTARTITISNDYNVDPNGEIDIVNGEVDFGGSNVITTGPLFPGNGTSMDDVRQLLGEPDVEGQVALGSGGNQIMLRLFSYSFIGMEVFFTYNARTTLFISLHPPYYGGTGMGNPTLGATRTDFEAYLIMLGFAPGVESTAQPGVFCYKLNDTRAVGATYTSANPSELSAILVGYPLVQRNCP
jgi:hypothetical protein